MTSDPSVFLEVAREAALAAGRCVMEWFRRSTPIEFSRKADRSPVTEADRTANALVCELLRRRFPDHGILSEEMGREGPSQPEFLWLVDPLDGTRAFVKGLAGFSVMVGLLRGGVPQAGVVYDPCAQTLFEAQRGAGAFLVGPHRRTPLRVSQRTDRRTMPVITSPGFPSDWRRTLEQKGALSFLNPTHSVGVKVGYLVRRLADIYFNHHPVHFWDTCAPSVILAEAGGRMTHGDGTALTYSMEGDWTHAQATVASNGVRHEELVTLFQSLSRP